MRRRTFAQLTAKRWAVRGVVAITALSAACGSTVQPTTGQQAVGLGSDIAAVQSGTPTDIGAGGGTESVGGTGADGALGGAGATSDGASGAVAPTDQQPAAGGAPNAGSAQSSVGVSGAQSGHGYTAKEIYVGFFTWSEVSDTGKAIGYAVDYGDGETIAKAVINDINKRGGIAGRKVVPVFYDYKTSDVLSNPEKGDAEACSRMTDDRPVFAVVATTGVLTESLPACLAKRGTTLIINNNAPLPRTWYTRYAPHFYSTANPMVERYIPIWLRRAAAIGYFDGWDTTLGAPGKTPTKIGILVNDSPAGANFAKLVEQELARQGRKAAATVAVANFLDHSGMSAAVLKFKSEGVTHVIPDLLLLILFPQAAESQRYRPRYVLSTAQAPILLQNSAPPEQLAGSLGMGYWPSSDVDRANDPGDISPMTGRCRQLQRQAGQNPDQREAWSGMTKTCDGLEFLRLAVQRGGLNPNGMLRGVYGIHTMPPAGAFKVSFTGNRTDGLAAFRDLGFTSACKCFRYLSKANQPM